MNEKQAIQILKQAANTGEKASVNNNALDINVADKRGVVN